MSKKRTAVLEDLLDQLVVSKAPTSQARRKVRNEEKAIRAAIGNAKRKQKIELEEDFMPLEEKRKLKRIANMMKRVLKRVKDNSKRGKKYKVSDIDQVIRLAKDNELLEEDAEQIAKMIQGINYMNSANTLFQKGKAEVKLNDVLNNLFIEADEVDNVPKEIEDLDEDMTKEQLQQFLLDQGVKAGTIQGMSKAKLNDLATRIVLVKKRQKRRKNVGRRLEDVNDAVEKKIAMRRLGRNKRMTEMETDELRRRRDALDKIRDTRGNGTKAAMIRALSPLLGDSYEGKALGDMDYNTELKPLFNRIKLGKVSGLSASDRADFVDEMVQKQKGDDAKVDQSIASRAFKALDKNTKESQAERARQTARRNPFSREEPKGTPLKDRISRAKGRTIRDPSLARQAALSGLIDEAADQFDDGAAEPDLAEEQEDEPSYGKGGEARARARAAAAERAAEDGGAGTEESKTVDPLEAEEDGAAAAIQAQVDPFVDGDGSGINKRLDELINWLDSRLRQL